MRLLCILSESTMCLPSPNPRPLHNYGRPWQCTGQLTPGVSVDRPVEPPTLYWFWTGRGWMVPSATVNHRLYQSLHSPRELTLAVLAVECVIIISMHTCTQTSMHIMEKQSRKPNCTFVQPLYLRLIWWSACILNAILLRAALLSPKQTAWHPPSQIGSDWMYRCTRTTCSPDELG